MVLTSAGGGGTPKLADVKRVRSLFPETWIWLEYNARSDMHKQILVCIFCLINLCWGMAILVTSEI